MSETTKLPRKPDEADPSTAGPPAPSEGGSSSASGEAEVDGFRVEAGIDGVRLTGGKIRLPDKLSTQALLLGMAGIMFPPVFLSIKIISMREVSVPTVLLVICAALFATIVFLWILDAVQVIEFRSRRVAVGIWTIAITSVLGTTVSVYKDALLGKGGYEYDGSWELRMVGENGEVLNEHQVLLVYSDSTGGYWGRSNLVKQEGGGDYSFVYVDEFYPDDGKLYFRHVTASANDSFVIDVKEEREGVLWTGSVVGHYEVSIIRSK